MTKYVKFMISSYEFASRNRREVAVVSSLGHSVAVSDVGKEARIEHDGSVIVHHRRKATHPWAPVRRGLILFDWVWRVPIHLRSFEARCLSCHDLIALSIGWFSTLPTSRSRRPQLVYDSHEFELGRTRARPRSAVRMGLIKLWERFLISRCAFVISVNDSIAGLLQDVHNLEQRPLVVRSTPLTWLLDASAIRACRENLCSMLGAEPPAFIAMYHGGVVPNRGIENFLRALVDAPDVAAIVLGDGSSTYLDELKLLAKANGVGNRVLFHPAVPVDQLRHYVASADVGVMPIRAVSQNNLLSLPNKLFENIQALTPVIGSAYPELTRIIDGYRIGLTVDPESPQAIAAALRRIADDQQLYEQFKRNLRVAKDELCWEREQVVLKDRYADLLGVGPSLG